MLKNYLTIAFRNLIKHRSYSFINIGGLSIGIGTCMLILVYVAHQYSFDSFHQNADRIYTAYAKIKMGGDSVQFQGMSYPTGPAVAKADPSIESSIRLQDPWKSKVVMNPADPSKKFSEENFLFADSNFFRFFNFHLQQGNPDAVLTRPFSVVITAAAARKYFGNADPIGKFLRYDSAYTFQVTGIVAPAPSNSSIKYDFIAAQSSVIAMKDGASLLNNPDILYGDWNIYYRLKPGTQSRNVEKTIQRLAAQNKIMKDVPARYYLRPFIGNNLSGDNASNGKYLTVFPLVAGLILLLALINYMNLATARATLRAKEVGVRKASGASRSRIAQQFYVESALYAVIAFIIGLGLFHLAEPAFYHIIGLTIDPTFIYHPLIITLFAGLLLLTILLAGSYPSLVLSAFNPIATLYGRMSRQQGGTAVRKTLTIIQFSVSTILVISSILIEKQLYFFRHTDTGVNRSNVLAIPFSHTIGNHYPALKKDIRDLAGISGVATANYELYLSYNLFQADLGGGKVASLAALNVDDQYIPLLDMQWKYPPIDHNIYYQDRGIIINETAIRALQLPANPVGHQLTMDGDKKYIVAGVLKDFNYSSLHSRIEAACLLIDKDSAGRWGAVSDGCMMVRINPRVNLPTTIESIKKIYEHYDNTTPFAFDFLDETFARRYDEESKLAGILGVFTGLTVLIACLGLLGLATFLATQKAKEISIRKILGASVQSLMLLLTKDFIRLVLIAILIAIPISWYVMHRWLQNFAYKISIGWVVFAVAGGAALIISALTVSVEAFRSATADPAKNLRSE